MNIRKRLEELERRFGVSDDAALLALIAAACRGVPGAHEKLERLVATTTDEDFCGHIRDLAVVYLGSPVPSWPGPDHEMQVQ